MSLFKRAVASEVSSHASIVFSTLIVIWLSVVLVRLLGEAARGNIGADVVLGLATLSALAALPSILVLAVFIGVLTTVSRSYRENEMVVWFTSGVSLLDWVRPVLRLAIPVAIIVALLTLYATPWSHRQIQDYRTRYELRSTVAQITTGEFLEFERGDRVVLVEAAQDDPEKLGEVFIRLDEGSWHSVVSAQQARMEIAPNGDRFLVLVDGIRYDLVPGELETRLSEFDEFAVRLESSGAENTLEIARRNALANRKSRPFELLLTDTDLRSSGQIMARFALPVATIILALLAIPLGAVNPRMGRSFDLLVAGLVALLYMNLINLSHGWINNGTLPFAIGSWLVHAVFLLLMIFLFWLRVRVRAPKNTS